MKCKTCNGLGRTKATEFAGVDEGLREVVILCPTCGGTGKVVHPMMNMNGDEYTGEWEQHECEACDGTGVVEPLTEEEWLKSLDTKQLAKWIDNLLMRCLCRDCNFCPIHKEPHCTCEAIEEWLKQPHKEKHEE